MQNARQYAATNAYFFCNSGRGARGRNSSARTAPFFAVRDFSVRSLRSLSRNDRVGGRAGVSLGRNDTVIKNIIPTVSIAPFSVISTETNEVSEAEKSFFAYPA